MLIKEYVKYWFYTYRMPHQARNTQETTWNLIRNHIVDSSLGERELTEVTVKELQEFLTGELLHGSKMRMWHSDKIGTPLSHHSAVKLRQILIAMYKQAVKEGYLNRNLAEDTEPIPLPWHDAPIFTPENQRKFLQATRHHRYHTAYVMLFFLGLRRSELLGLSWDAVDMKRNLLHIRQVLVVEDHQIVIRERTKTRASIRTVPFPLEIKCMLQDWRKKQKVESMTPGYDNKYHLVFCNKDGSPINKEEIQMAKPANYNAKINILNEKIEKKSAAIKQLKAELQEIKAKQEAERMKELVAFMEESDMSASRALELIQKGLGKEKAEQPAPEEGQLENQEN